MGAEVSLDRGSSIPGCMIMMHPGATTVNAPSPLPPEMMLTSRLPLDMHSLHTSVHVHEERLVPNFSVPAFSPSSSSSSASTRGTKRMLDDSDEYDGSPSSENSPKLTRGEKHVPEKKAKKEKPPADPQGFRFRKYGKKMIGEEARHYYRCTFPSCDAKRHVTYSDAGPNVVSIGY